MRKAGILTVVLALTSACGSAATGARGAVTVTSDGRVIENVVAKDPAATDLPHPAQNGTWVGVAAESDVLLAGDSSATLGVWIDAPEARPHAHVPVDVSLVIDTSGSMAGAKIENARRAAGLLIDNLADGDIVSIVSFSDDARTIVEPSVLSSDVRRALKARINQLQPTGSTNMFDGLGLGESLVARAPSTHAVRRVVVISDGIANVGQSSPEALGALAERGLRFHAQVTSLGVGTDYDERTLNALALRLDGTPLSPRRAARDGLASHARARAFAIDGRDRCVRRNRSRARRGFDRGRGACAASVDIE